MGDTIVIETPVATVIEVSGLQGPQGPTGPQGPAGDVSGSIAWSNVTGKPSTFTPSAHTHTSADVTDFAAAVVAAAPPTTNASLLTSGTLPDARLSAAVTTSLGKADTASQPGHTHTATEISDSTATGRSVLTATDAAAARTAIGAQASGSYAAAAHTHAIADVTGLQTALDGKQASGSYAAASHTHAASDIASGTLDNARVNWAAPSALGSTTAAAATVTDLKADTLTMPKSGQPAILANVSSGNLSAAGQISAATLTTATGGSVIVASGGALRLESGAAVVDSTDTTKKLALNLSGIPTGTTRTLTISTSGDIHAQSHAITSTSDHTATANRVFYSNNSGQVTELALGAANTVLTSNGTTSAPSFAAVSAGATNLWIPASAWIPRTTTGCGVDSTELSTNKVNTDQLLFDTATEEYAQAMVMMPSNYNYGTITARFYWTASSGSGGVAFGLRGRAYADDDALDQAQGTGQVTTDTFIVADDLHVTAATSAITLAGTPAANRPVQFEIYRQVSNASDTLGVDARLLGVEVIFN